MRIAGRAGRRRLRFDVAEAVLLGRLFEELESSLDGSDDGAEPDVTARLYPSAYRDDEKAADEFRSLTESSLRDERLERLAACRADLADPVGGVEVDLSDGDTGRRWLQVLNDLRLVHGTRLGISEDDDTVLDPGDPAQAPLLVYHWLTAVQDTLVGALMR